MSQTTYKTFEIPLREDSGFEPKYAYSDIGLNPDDLHFFGYIDWYGLQLPPKDTILPISSWADEILYTHYVTQANAPQEHNLRAEITVWNIPSDIILKLQSLPGVKEVETTQHHLYNILKKHLRNDTNTTQIIEAIKND